VVVTQSPPSHQNLFRDRRGNTWRHWNTMVHANVRRLVLQSLGTTSPECGICLEPFAHADATVMECCHVTCKGCFNQLRKSECPFCRHKFAAPQRTRRETNHEINLLRRDVAMLNNEVTYLERENDLLEQRLRNVRPRGASPQPVSHIGRDPVYVPTDPTYSPATPRFSPDPPPAEWEARVTTPRAPQPLTRTVSRVLFVDSDTESDTDTDAEVREATSELDLTLLDLPPPETTNAFVPLEAPRVRRTRAPCRCTLCGEFGHQRNNRRFHPVNTLTN